MNGLNYKYRFLISIIGLLIAYGAVYVRLMNPTVNKLQYIMQSDSQLQMVDVDAQLIQTKSDYSRFMKSLKVFSDEIEIQHFMVDFISQNAHRNRVELYHIYEPHHYEINNYRVVNQAFEIKGDFKSLMKLIYKLEFHKEPIQIKTIKLESRKNQTKNKNELYAIMYVQSIASI